MMNGNVVGNVALKETPKWYYDVKERRLYIVHQGKYVLISRAILDEATGDSRFAYLENSRRITLLACDELEDIPVY